MEAAVMNSLYTYLIVAAILLVGAVLSYFIARGRPSLSSLRDSPFQERRVLMVGADCTVLHGYRMKATVSFYGRSFCTTVHTKVFDGERFRPAVFWVEWVRRRGPQVDGCDVYYSVAMAEMAASDAREAERGDVS